VVSHLKTSLFGKLHRFKDGLYRLVAYIPGDPDWKNVERQFRVTLEQALAAVERGELYVAVDFGGGRRSLVHSRELVRT
jgi:hypothetical protein